MKKWHLAVACALVLVVLSWFAEKPAPAPHRSATELLSRFAATALQMGVDSSHTNPDVSFDKDRSVVRSSGRDAAMYAAYGRDGQLVDWYCRRCAALSNHSATEDKAVQALTESQASRFSFVDRDVDSGRSRWRSSDGKSEAEIDIEDGVVTRAAVHPVGAREGTLNRSGSRVLGFFRGLSGTIFWVFTSIAGSIVSVAFFRRVDVRRLFLVVILFWLGLYLVALLMEAGRVAPGGVSYHLVWHPLLWAVPCAAGFARLRGDAIEKWTGLLHAVERRRAARRSGVELWNGMLLAWPLALAAYQLPASDLVSQRIPALSAMLGEGSVEGDIVLYFAFIVPVVSKWAAVGRWRTAILLSLGVLLFGAMRHSGPLESWLEMVSGLAVLAVSWWVYASFGLLGVLSAAVASTVAGAIAGLAAGPSHFVGLIASCGVYGIGLAGAQWLQKQGSAGEDEELVNEIRRRSEPFEAMELRSERQFLLTEFAEAREAQMGMLPAQAPAIPGFGLAAVCLPAREVGGDLYDFIAFPDGRWGLCVADVSGKGVPAALYMTMTKGVLASEQRVSTDLKSLALALNERLFEAGQRKIFVTMAMARLDPARRCVELLRAGHNPVLWRRAQQRETVWLKPAGLGLGMVANAVFKRKLDVQNIQLQPGDTLVIYSDGLTEAENPRREGFGEERLEAIAALADEMSPQDFVARVLGEVEQFKEGADPHDDLTIVVLKADGSDSRTLIG